MANKKIGITASTFDLLHSGHCAMLREAKSVCDYLICALQNDPSIDRPGKNKPIQPQGNDFRRELYMMRKPSICIVCHGS